MDNSGRGIVKGPGSFQRMLQSCKRNWKNYTLALITVVALLW
jgi:hypothetical protein